MRKIALILAAAAVSACARNPFSSMEPASPAFDMSSPLYGPNFVHIAASSNLLEIQSSRLALQVSSDPAVRSFAEMIIADHTQLAGKIAAAAKGTDIGPPPPEALMPMDQARIDRLRATPAASFDAALRDLQIAAHQQAISLFQAYSAQGDNPTLRSIASQALVMLQKHLSAAEALPIAPALPLSSSPLPPPAAGRGERG